jgi:uncharacterized protein
MGIKCPENSPVARFWNTVRTKCLGYATNRWSVELQRSSSTASLPKNAVGMFSFRLMFLRVRRQYRRWRRFLTHNILHTDDSPHKIALGMAIGAFVTFTPTVGVQMAVVLLLAWLLRANKVVGLPVVWLTNPATIVPFYWLCYEIGRILLGTPPVGQQWWLEMASPPAGWLAIVQFYWSRFWQIGWPLWVGGCIVGLIAALPAYYLTYYGVRSFRMRQWGQLTRPSRPCLDQSAPTSAEGTAPSDTRPSGDASRKAG